MLSISVCFSIRRCFHCFCASVAALMDVSKRSSCLRRESCCRLIELSVATGRRKHSAGPLRGNGQLSERVDSSLAPDLLGEARFDITSTLLEILLQLCESSQTGREGVVEDGKVAVRSQICRARLALRFACQLRSERSNPHIFAPY